MMGWSMCRRFGFAPGDVLEEPGPVQGSVRVTYVPLGVSVVGRSSSRLSDNRREAFGRLRDMLDNARKTP